MKNLLGKYLTLVLVLVSFTGFSQVPCKISLTDTIILDGAFLASEEISLKEGFKGSVAGGGSFCLKLSGSGASSTLMKPEVAALKEENESNPQVELIIAPNPAGKATTISFFLGEQRFQKLILRSLAAIEKQFAELTKSADGDYKMAISTSDYAPGIYYVILVTNKGSHSYPLIIK